MLSGPYNNTNFAEVFKAAAAAQEPSFIKLEDFKPYEPSYFGAASFIASPVFDGEKKVGVAIFQMPIDNINSVLTGAEDWESLGLGKTGQSYLVGSDGKMKSISRGIAEQPENYREVMKAGGHSSEEIDLVMSQGTTIGIKSVKGKAVQEALSGSTGASRQKNAYGIDALQSYAPVSIEDVSWGIISEIQSSEALQPISALTTKVLL